MYTFFFFSTSFNTINAVLHNVVECYLRGKLPCRRRFTNYHWTEFIGRGAVWMSRGILHVRKSTIILIDYQFFIILLNIKMYGRFEINMYVYIFILERNYRKEKKTNANRIITLLMVYCVCVLTEFGRGFIFINWSRMCPGDVCGVETIARYLFLVF